MDIVSASKKSFLVYWFLLLVLSLSACVPPSPSAEHSENDVQFEGPGMELNEDYNPTFPPLSGLTGREFRAMTYNVHLWDKLKVKPNAHVTELVKKAGKAQRKETAIFDLFKLWGAHIIAVQEVYAMNKAGINFKSSHGKYNVLFGEKIYQDQFCLIVYDTDKMSCDGSRTALSSKGQRKTHWARCTLNPSTPKKTFYFGCTSFGTKTQDINNNLDDMYDGLTKNPAPKTTGANPDSFILGMDANSYQYGHLSSVWTLLHNRYQANLPKPPAIVREKIKPESDNGGFTKIYKRKQGGKAVIKVTNTVNKRIIDELIWAFQQNITYKPNSKQIIPVTSLKPANMSWPDFWVEYYKLSDHIPVKADFRY